MAETAPGVLDGVPAQFIHESALGPPELPPEPGPRPDTVVNLDAVAPLSVERPRTVRTRRNLGRAAGSVTTGLQHCELAPGKESAPPHCHSLEEEIFVILEGEVLLPAVEQDCLPRGRCDRSAGAARLLGRRG